MDPRRMLIAFALYGIIIGILIWMRPPMLMTAGFKPKPFGVSGDAEMDTSIFAPVVLFPLIAVFCYFVSAFIFLIWTPKMKALPMA